ncbi:hypothetical protein JO972_07365 [Verrucomicrobiaceae bacterium 5K15]|uniref:FecR protein domain-containing protein n=1 Tax=Oceaniferula flava TaxID=2800421 RepID=A0AAE2V822_9BACT|nr:LamG-like jellyroll fold domain-containing protein [Oceaniferula flavus]MBK1854772.1 hypothetical protein [Oceaniferula flavus]MBM1136078.1 hypothetical protein [Oceaniferula flavus]
MEDFAHIPAAHRELIQSLIDGTLSPVETARVNALLRECPVLREFYIQQTRTDELLSAHFAHTGSSVLLRRPEPVVSRRKHTTAIVLSLSFGIAATVALMLTLGKVFFTPEAAPAEVANYSEFIPAPDRTPIARVSGSKEVTWTQSTGNLRPGHWLSAGKIELKSGMLELSYDSGSTVLIKAPATYYIEAENHGFLEKGSIRAYSPPTVSAFYVDTPNSELVDLGTTFGVTVLNALSTQVHVIDGLVKARAIGAHEEAWKHLLAGKALQIDNNNDTTQYKPLVADTSFYDWARPARARRSETIAHTHWSFDQRNGKQFPETGNHGNDSTFPATFVHFSNSDPSPQLTPGRYGSALRLDGNESFLRTDYPGIGGDKARTVAFWLRLDPNQPSDEALPGIVCWGKNASRGAKWQIRPITPLQEDTKKVIRTECAWGGNTGMTDINDGKWHHIVSVFMGGNGADIATHVKHYVDGRLETRGSITSRRVDTATTTDPNTNFPLCIGLKMEESMANSLETLIQMRKEGKHRLPTLKGDIDELYVFDDALTPQEIINLMARNQPPK